MTTNRETTPPIPNAGEWIEWHGGENPVPGQMVQILRRYREDLKHHGGSYLSDSVGTWAHRPIGYGGDDDIIAYRLATPPPAAQEPDYSHLRHMCCGQHPEDGHAPECDREVSSPAPQDDPAKGLEVVAWRWRANLWSRGEWRLTDEKPELGGFNCKTTMQSLTDHATAERQIAELRSRVAELESQIAAERRSEGLWIDEHNRALAAEAENKGLRELIDKHERTIARQHKQASTSRSFWLRAARASLNGDMRELRNRVDLADAPPVDVVLSLAAKEAG